MGNANIDHLIKAIDELFKAPEGADLEVLPVNRILPFAQFKPDDKDLKGMELEFVTQAIEESTDYKFSEIQKGEKFYFALFLKKRTRSPRMLPLNTIDGIAYVMPIAIERFLNFR